jgi:hypothetical protein
VLKIPEREAINMPLITCPECSHEISDQAEACPHCGFPVAKQIAEKAKSSIKSDGLTSKVIYVDSKKSTTSQIDGPVKLIVSLIAAVIYGSVSGSALIGVATFFLFLFAWLRVDYLANNLNKRLKYERHLYGWKGIVAYTTLIIIICLTQQGYYQHVKGEFKLQVHHMIF